MNRYAHTHKNVIYDLSKAAASHGPAGTASHRLGHLPVEKTSPGYITDESWFSSTH